MKAVIMNRFASFINGIEERLAQPRAKRRPSRNLHNVLHERAVVSSADFVEKYLSTALVFRTKPEMWGFAADKVSEKFSDGVCLEFGVAGGKSINWMSKKLPAFEFFGFDSFVGLAEDWVGHHAKKGAYSQGGVTPKVNKNVRLVKGWFDETIPKFIQEIELERIRFIHIDSDTYPAAQLIFQHMGKHLTPGMFVLFDELIGYPGWDNGELKALNEAEKECGFQYRFLGFTTEQALIEIV